MKLFLNSFFLILTISVFAQPASVLQLSNDVNELIYSAKYDSAQNVVLKFLGKKNLSEEEIFWGNYLFGDVLKSSGKMSESVRQFQKCKDFIQNLQQKNLYESLLSGKLSEVYFDMPDYPEAKKFAERSLLQSPDSSLRAGGHAVNFIILGYSNYTEQKYEASLACYEKAISEYMKAGEYCELPLCYTKIAKVQSKMKNEKEVKNYIEKSVFISDSCKIKHYKLISLYTILDIHKENKNFENALKILEEINELVKEIGFEKQRQLMNELEVKYETKLAQTENKNLKEINLKNEEILWQQKIVIAVTIIAVLILSALIFFIVKQNRELKRLHILNQKIFSVISHDFRGPILSLQLLLKALNEKKIDETKISNYTEDISFQLVQTKQVLENLINWAKTELNISVQERKSCNPCAIANEISAEQKIITGKKNIAVKNHISPKIELWIPSDILRIVFRNLLSNAIKFSYENSEITFDYDEKQISVKDFGTGMDENKIKNLFQKDVLPSLGTWKESGFGLGLFITHELLHRFNGKISVEKNSPHGTVFYISVPMAE